MLPSAVSDSRVHNILPNKIETDFQFSRASAATRVNHQGLIEDVGYFGPELVQNGNFSELGPELVTNGGFDTDSNWTKGAGWSINDGKATYQGTISSNLRQSNVLVSGKTHKLVFEVTSNTSDGNLKLAGETVSGGGLDVPETVGVHTVYFVNTGSTTNFAFRVTNNTTGVLEIDNVSVKQVDPNDRWNLDTGWLIENGIAISSGLATKYLYQNIGITSSKIYKCTIEIKTLTSGQVDLQYYNGSFVNIGSNLTVGTNTLIFTAAGSPNGSIYVKSASFVGTVGNVSVVEVQGDKPRLDYDPTNLTCPHLLLEPQSTNLIEFSEDFSQSYWFKQDLTATQGSIISPTGELNTYLIQETSYTSSIPKLDLLTSISLSAGTYTLSFYVQNNKGRYLGISFGSATERVRTNFDFETNTFKALNLSGTTTGSASFTTLGDFYRISITATFPSTTASKNTIVPLATDTYPFFALQDSDNRSFYIFGAQLEQQSYATSYIPTAGATETRVAETCDSAGNVNTFNSTEGVLYAEIAALESPTTSALDISISDGTTNNYVRLEYYTDGKIYGTIYDGSFAASSAVVTQNNFNKIAVQWNSSGNKFALNGVVTDFTGKAFSANTLNVLQFAAGNSTSSIFHGKTKALATYNRALTDTELYTITSTQYSAYSGMVAALGNYTIPC